MKAPQRRWNDALEKSIFLSIVLSKKAALKPPFKLLKIEKNKKSAFLETTHSLAVSSHKTDTAFFEFRPLMERLRPFGGLHC
jgi:hypothetical protein